MTGSTKMSGSVAGLFLSGEVGTSKSCMFKDSSNVRWTICWTIAVGVCWARGAIQNFCMGRSSGWRQPFFTQWTKPWIRRNP